MKALIFLMLILMSVIGCERDESGLEIDPNLTYEFKGSFTTGNQSGSVLLRIESDRYYCTTDLPYGKGAGRLEIINNEIEFIDTLLFPVPALYGPSWVTSGKHIYRFDGSELKLYRRLDQGIIFYDLSKSN